MLIKNYSPKQSGQQLNHSFNNTLKNKNKPDVDGVYEEATIDNLTYLTNSIPETFQNLDSHLLNTLFEEQKEAATQEAKIFLKYNLLTKSTYEKTLKQYNQYYFHTNGLTYPKQLIKEFITLENLQDETFIQQPTKQQPTQQQTPLPQTKQQQTPLQQYEISRQAIRNVTGYTHSPIPQWSYKPPYNTPQYQRPTNIKWQYALLEDQSDTIVVNGSRQMGKSFTIAERAIEESFLPENDTLVGAFLVKTTNVIRNYILKLTKKFPDGTFIHYKSEGYILNTQSNTVIHFRTLADGAENVLGLTLYNIIVDEAQLIDDTVFDDALLPTLTTTGGRLIMIGTPGKKQKGYYFKKMIEAKKQLEDPTTNKYEKISLYEVTIEKNPLVHPKIRKRIMDKRDEPAIQRQYFCSWSANTDQLFKPKIITQLPDNGKFSKSGYLVLGIDPARLQDRAGYTLNYVFNHKITTILSGEVPKAFKSKWELQAHFYKKLIERYKPLVSTPTIQGLTTPKPHFYTVMDIGGVGDAVKEIFQNNGVHIDIGIRYTTGFNPDTKLLDWKIPKSQLINTKLDFISEEVYQVFQPSNKDLLEELEYIYEDELRNGQIAMSSTFFDDITNSNMISLSVIKERKFVSRAISETEAIGLNPNDNMKGWVMGIEEPNQRYRTQQKARSKKDKQVW